MLAVAAEACVREPRLVYQPNGDSNPNNMERIVGLLGLYKRKHFPEKDSGFKLLNELAGRMESQNGQPRRALTPLRTPMIPPRREGLRATRSRATAWGGGRFTDVGKQR